MLQEHLILLISDLLKNIMAVGRRYSSEVKFEFSL